MRPSLVFSEEPMTKELIDEMVPLIIRHWIEVGRKDVKLEPQFDHYLKLQKMGWIKTFTARSRGVLAGYAVFIIKEHHHYSLARWAIQDLIYLAKEHRKGWAGYRFVKFMDRMLEDDDVSVISMSVNYERDFGSLLARLGYTPSEMIFTRRT